MLKLKQIQTMFRADAEFTAKWRRQAKQDFDFYAGDQWTEDEKSWLAENLRVPVVFNRTATIINTVAGNEIQNREEIRYFPMEPGDIQPNEVLDGAAKWFRKEAYAEDAESEGFLDSLICGMGWTETRIDYSEDPEGSPSMSAPHPTEMYWDCSARQKGLRDAKRVWRVREMTLEEALDIMDMEDRPGVRAKLDAAWVKKFYQGEDEPHDQDRADQYLGGQDGDPDTVDAVSVKVTLVQLQIKEKRVMHRYRDEQTKELKFFTKKELEKINNRLRMNGYEPLKTIKQKKWVYVQYWVGADVLEDPIELPTSCFTFKCITGYRDRNSGAWFGLISLMRDPQKWANKWLSQILHILNTSAKGGVMAERSAIGEDTAEFMDSWAKNEAVTLIEDGGMDRIKEKPQAKVPTGLFQLMDFAITSIREASGVNIEMLGQRAAVQAVGLEAQRKEAGLTILAPIFDSLRYYRVDHGKLMLYFIQTYLSDGRLIRITSQATQKYVPLAVRQSAKFDIIVDEAPSSPHIKEKVWAFITPMIDKIPPQILASLLQYSPLPGSVVEELRAMLMQMSQPQPQQQAMEQIGMEQAVADVEMTRSAAAAERAQAGKLQSDAQNDKLRNIIELMKGPQNGPQ
jgi:hypothetical protein